jgi:hypothetical protein
LVHAGREGEEHGNARRAAKNEPKAVRTFAWRGIGVSGKFRLPLEALSMLIKLQPQASSDHTPQVRQAAVHLA